jgi:membrane associated rhomboid family serine protease
MGFRDRDYYRKSNSSGQMADWGFYWVPRGVRYLIIANVVVFLLQMLVVTKTPISPLDIARQRYPQLDELLKERGDDPASLAELEKEDPRIRKLLENIESQYGGMTKRDHVLENWLLLDPNKVVEHGQVWRLLTHAFCHDRLSIWHILLNMLFLYWFGCTLESMYGTREFVLFYLSAAVVAGIAYVGVDLAMGSNAPAIGASGAVMAVTMLYALHFPYETIYVMWFLPLPMWLLMVFYVIWDVHPLLLQLGGEQFSTGIGHAAHLGGLAFGFLYGWFQWRLEPLVAWIPGMRGGTRPDPIRYRDRTTSRSLGPDPEMERVDEILRKISDVGQASLTDEERALLASASERMKRRRHD